MTSLVLWEISPEILRKIRDHLPLAFSIARCASGVTLVLIPDCDRYRKIPRNKTIARIAATRSVLMRTRTTIVVHRAAVTLQIRCEQPVDVWVHARRKMREAAVAASSELLPWQRDTRQRVLPVEGTESPQPLTGPLDETRESPLAVRCLHRSGLDGFVLPACLPTLRSAAERSLTVQCLKSAISTLC